MGMPISITYRPSPLSRFFLWGLLFKTQSLVLVEGYFYCIEKNQRGLGLPSYLNLLLFPGCKPFFAFAHIFSKISLSPLKCKCEDCLDVEK